MSGSTAYLALGSNLGNREGTLRAAVVRMNDSGICIKAFSSFYETEPQGFIDQPWFLNAVVRCETELKPLALLHTVRQIEQQFGRTRDEHAIPQGPRTLDLDILLYGNASVNLPELKIPHPHMLERRFVLEPLLEIAPEIALPSGETIATYLAAVQTQQIHKLV